MKKIFILAAAALGMLAACTEIERSEMAGPQEIQFEAYSARATKATIVDAAVLQTSGFWVSGIYRGTEYLNDKVKYITGHKRFEQSSSVVKYWPADVADYPISFYATNAKIDATDNPITYTSGTPATLSFNYTTASDSASQFDVVVAASGNVKSVPTSANTTVDDTYKPGCQDLTFTHALTKVNFSFIGADGVSGLTYTVTDLELQAYVTGTYVFGFGWSGISNYTKITYKIPDGTTWTTGDATALESNLMLIPQVGQISEDGTTWLTDSGNIACSITYEVKDASNVVLYKGTKTFTISTKVTVSGTDHVWAPTKSFRYTLKLGVGAQPITFAATVNSWDSEVTGEININ